MRRAKLVLKPLPLQALYTVAQLARAIGISHRRFARLLAGWNILTLTVGKEQWVPMSELEGKLEPLWDSILAAVRAEREIASRMNAGR
jgi:hypothetical protein